MTQKYTTSDWQWYLQDIATQIDQQMKPDANEVERFQASGHSRRNLGSGEGPPSSRQSDAEPTMKLSPRRSKSKEEEGIEMPAVASTQKPR